MNNSFRTRLGDYVKLLVFLLLLGSVGWAQEIHKVEHGSYAEVSAGAPRRLVVVLHGTVGDSETALEVAQRMALSWLPTAQRHEALVVAPAFDDHNFGGKAGPFGGYRGMFGRVVGADVFLNEVVADVVTRHERLKGKFYLYGHSAGGQMVSRYLVTHPRRVRRAVISAAGTYAFPDSKLPWTDGMAPIDRDYVWRPGDPVEHFSHKPDPDGWLQAAQIPVTVVVGSNDRGEIPQIKGLPQADLLGRSSHWVRAMGTLARQHGKASKVRWKAVPGAGHDSAELLPACVKALF